MKYERSNKIKTAKQIMIALGVFISRLGMLPANMSPVGAFGFFSSNPIFFISSFVAFDYFVGGFYQGFWFNYLGFGIYWLIGRLAGKNINFSCLDYLWLPCYFF